MDRLSFLEDLNFGDRPQEARDVELSEAFLDHDGELPGRSGTSVDSLKAFGAGWSGGIDSDPSVWSDGLVSHRGTPTEGMYSPRMDVFPMVGERLTDVLWN